MAETMITISDNSEAYYRVVLSSALFYFYFVSFFCYTLCSDVRLGPSWNWYEQLCAKIQFNLNNVFHFVVSLRQDQQMCVYVLFLPLEIVAWKLFQFFFSRDIHLKDTSRTHTQTHAHTHIQVDQALQHFRLGNFFAYEFRER